MITFYYYVVWYCKVKSAEEEDPSDEILSVVVGDLSPPNSKTSPEGSDQQRWFSLSSTRVTLSGVKVPSASNFTQDLRLGYWLVFMISFTFFSMKYIYLEVGHPPQTISWQRLKPILAVGRWPTEQVVPVLGLNTSAELRADPTYPPAIKTPETKHNYVPPLTVSQEIVVTYLDYYR